ncbi:TlpA family protein disulfide reductase [Fulvivirgaceae bacterium PWU5]|uniref:TlpA family protein disulfide reductase n=1 Tax=Dawidia cretensis TaxID=2782350 RepID=A0AAP2E457_9BACT|nr:TlpA disulfide reductase family protein [Dawidia cretensis]MBT1711319.1 TlpA family protein disulfide reductase [Dawidia cretensis]
MVTTKIKKACNESIGYQIFILLLLLLLNSQEEVLAQSNAKLETKLTEDEIEGSEMLQYTFTRVKNYKKQGEIEKVLTKELRGKWTILYFWTKNCTPCIRSFPKLDKIQKRYSSNAQVFLVGIKDMWNKNIEPYYDGVRNAQGINLPIAYDTGLLSKLTIIYASTVVMVNPEGTIEKVFLSDDLLSRKIKAIMRKRKMKKGA